MYKVLSNVDIPLPDIVHVYNSGNGYKLRGMLQYICFEQGTPGTCEIGLQIFYCKSCKKKTFNVQKKSSRMNTINGK